MCYQHCWRDIGVTLFRRYHALKLMQVGDVMFCNLLDNFGEDTVVILQRMDQPLGDLSLCSAVLR